MLIKFKRKRNHAVYLLYNGLNSAGHVEKQLFIASRVLTTKCKYDASFFLLFCLPKHLTIIVHFSLFMRNLNSKTIYLVVARILNAHFVTQITRTVLLIWF